MNKRMADSARYWAVLTSGAVLANYLDNVPVAFILGVATISIVTTMRWSP